MRQELVGETQLGERRVDPGLPEILSDARPDSADAHAVLVRSATKIDAEAIAAAPSLKVVARAGVGLDSVDIKAATTAGVMVVNAPTSNIISAAELTVGHILSLARHIPAAHASLAAGAWKRSSYTGVELYEKTVGQLTALELKTAEAVKVPAVTEIAKTHADVSLKVAKTYADTARELLKA